MILLGDDGTDALDRVRALERGADDFVAKPFVYGELVARIRAVLRRAAPPPGDRLHAGAIVVDRPTRRVSVDGERVQLAGKEFELLLKLASDPERVFTKDELLRDVWGFRSLGSGGRLDPILSEGGSVRLVGYVRVSRVSGRGGDSFISPEDQRARLEAHAASNGHALVGWERDFDRTGRNVDRPGFEAAMRAVERGEADGIAVAKLNRFARSVVAAARALERLEAVDGVLVAVDVGMDTSTPAGKLMRNVLLSIAEFELDVITENWAAARESAIRRNVHISRVPPVGYLRAADGRLELDARTAPVIRDLFGRRAAGETWRGLCAFLDEELPREDGRPWPLSTVTGVVANPAYLGEARAGELVNKDAHEPLVTRAEWEAAQSVPTPRARKGEGALLTGIGRCADCDGPMTPNSDGKRGYRRYDCQNRTCGAPSAISMPSLDAHVESAFLSRLREVPPIVAEARLRGQRSDEALQGLGEAEAELAAYRDANLVSIIGREAYVAGLVERQARVDDAREELASARRELPVELPCHDLLETWVDLGVRERRTILAAGLEAVKVRQAHTRGRGTPVADRVDLAWRD